MKTEFNLSCLFLSLAIATTVVVTAQPQEVCGNGTEWNFVTSTCLCTAAPPSDQDYNYDSNVLMLAAIFDTTTYDWGPDVVEVTVQQLNRGAWGVLSSDSSNNSNNLSLEVALENSDCDETIAMRKYWKIRTELLEQKKPPMHGIIGTRCSGASMSLARISSLENVPQLSPASNTVQLSNADEFPLFSRLVAPNNEDGEVGALVAMMLEFGWERVTILATDAQFAKDVADQFGKLMGQTVGSGAIGYRDTIRRTPDGNVTQEEIDLVLDNIPTENPSTNSRVIFLAAHSQHAFPILKRAHERNFQPDTIWVGPSSWAGRSDYDNFSWLPSLPGYLGVRPFRDIGSAVYQDFLSELQTYQEFQGRPVLEELPVFAAETVDAIRAFTMALVTMPTPLDRWNGPAVVQRLRSLEFEGLSGQVAFAANGDRRDPRYAVVNAQVGAVNGNIVWEEIGSVGTKVGTFDLTAGIKSVCFAEVGCNHSKAPNDTYPLPELDDSIELWVILVMGALGILLIVALLKYWRSLRKKKKYIEQLEAFKTTVAGMCVAECKYYIPSSKSSQEKAGDIEKGAIKKSFKKPALVTAKWMWKETDGCMHLHSPTSIYGDPRDCWILYNDEANKMLEEAFQNKDKTASPLPGYDVDFSAFIQTKRQTGFERQVQRVVDTQACSDTDEETIEIDISDVEIGDEVPSDLEGEPLIVLVEGDVVQISKQRKDNWAFGTKLYHADEAVARQLVAMASVDVNDDEANVFPDTGWFQKDKTRMPTAEDLKTIQQNVGDAGALEPPEHWDPVVDPSVVQRHELPPGDSERTIVENAFLSTLRPPYFNEKVKVEKVERIQNLAMYQSYVVKRQTICHREKDRVASQDDSDDVAQRKALERFEKRWLWHGTNYEVLEKLLQQGFNRSFCGKNATAYGKGVYFARDASYSAYPIYSVPDKNGRQYMMACSVVVGEYCRGQHDALTPDIRDHKTQLLYDSTIGTSGDSMSNPSIFVTYHDSQAYPEYLITFKTA